MNLSGLLADVNVQGHLPYLQHLLESSDLWPILVADGIVFKTFGDLGLPRNLNDRSLWQVCQDGGWVLFTADRNNDGVNSLQATLDDSWQLGHLPILTLANVGRFENESTYAKRTADDVADILFGTVLDDYRDQPRIYVPR